LAFKLVVNAMDTAFEVMRTVLEYFGWDGNEIEVCLFEDWYLEIPSACDQPFKHFNIR